MFFFSFGFYKTGLFSFLWKGLFKNICGTYPVEMNVFLNIFESDFKILLNAISYPRIVSYMWTCWENNGAGLRLIRKNFVWCLLYDTVPLCDILGDKIPTYPLSGHLGLAYNCLRNGIWRRCLGTSESRCQCLLPDPDPSGKKSQYLCCRMRPL